MTPKNEVKLDDERFPVIGPDDGMPCCERCGKHPGNQWMLRPAYRPEPPAPSAELKERAREFLASRGLADLFLYWPHPKPIPQKDYPASEPQPTLESLMSAFASSIQEEARQQIESLKEQRDDMFDWRTKTAERCEALEQQLAEARAQVEHMKQDRDHWQRECDQAHEVINEFAAKRGIAEECHCIIGAFSRVTLVDRDIKDCDLHGAAAIERASLSAETEQKEKS